MADCNDGKLVNAFGAITLDETSRTSNELLEDILIQLKIMNIHLEAISDVRVSEVEITND